MPLLWTSSLTRWKWDTFQYPHTQSKLVSNDRSQVLSPKTLVGAVVVDELQHSLITETLEDLPHFFTWRMVSWMSPDQVPKLLVFVQLM